MNTVTAKIVTRNAYVDTWRGIAILGVVCVHFGGSFATPTHAWTPVFYTGLSLNQAFSFAVPLFVFLSGLLSGWSSKRPPVASSIQAVQPVGRSEASTTLPSSPRTAPR